MVLLKYNALYFSHIHQVVFVFIANSRKYHQILTHLNNNRWLKENSTKFRRLLKLGLLARIPAITKACSAMRDSRKKS